MSFAWAGGATKAAPAEGSRAFLAMGQAVLRDTHDKRKIKRTVAHTCMLRQASRASTHAYYACIIVCLHVHSLDASAHSRVNVASTSTAVFILTTRDSTGLALSCLAVTFQHDVVAFSAI